MKCEPKTDKTLKLSKKRGRAREKRNKDGI